MDDWRSFLGVGPDASEEDIAAAHVAKLAELERATVDLVAARSACEEASATLVAARQACDKAAANLANEKRQRDDDDSDDVGPKKKAFQTAAEAVDLTGLTQSPQAGPPPATLKVAVNEKTATAAANTTQAFDVPSADAERVFRDRLSCRASDAATLAIYGHKSLWYALFTSSGSEELRNMRTTATIHVSAMGGGLYAGIPDARFCFIKGRRDMVISVATRIHALLTGTA